MIGAGLIVNYNKQVICQLVSVAARLLRSWVRNPPGVWMSVCCGCCDLSGRGLCDELITRPEESYRLWCFNRSHPFVYLIFNKMVYPVFTQLQYTSFLATYFGFYKIYLQANVNHREVHTECTSLWLTWA
jgi:hypothetical protein